VSVQHVYSKTGTFAAVLTVTDNKGAEATASAQVVVTANPAASGSGTLHYAA